MIKAGSLVKMKWGYSPVGVVTKVVDHPFQFDGGQSMAAIIWTDSYKSNERITDLEVLDESR